MANSDGIAKKSTERVKWMNENVMTRILETVDDL